jgi:hypothetical protein
MTLSQQMKQLMTQYLNGIGIFSEHAVTWAIDKYEVHWKSLGHNSLVYSLNGAEKPSKKRYDEIKNDFPQFFQQNIGQIQIQENQAYLTPPPKVVAIIDHHLAFVDKPRPQYPPQHYLQPPPPKPFQPPFLHPQPAFRYPPPPPNPHPQFPLLPAPRGFPQ